MNRSKNAEEIAYTRCQILGPLLQSEMDPAKRAYEIQKIAEQHQLSEKFGNSFIRHSVHFLSALAP